jgi:hypothetical protein
MDPRLTDVAAQARQLRKEVSDAEWEGDPRTAGLARELKRLEALLAEGVTYEPKF